MGARADASLAEGTVRVAASAEARGLGTLAVLNYDIHAARFVQKSHTALPSAFASPLEVAPRTVWDRASAAVVVGSPQNFLALYGLNAIFGGSPNMAGALCLYRRSALHAIGDT